MFSDVIQQKERRTIPFLDQKYIPFVACAHETVQIAARLAEEAREIEKYNDSLMRKPRKGR
jgi:methylenetetrahydromethanopterin dehydrogenase